MIGSRRSERGAAVPDLLANVSLGRKEEYEQFSVHTMVRIVHFFAVTYTEATGFTGRRMD